MKKIFKRLAAMAMSVAMTFALAVPAFAEENTNNGKIQITNPVPEATYSAYKLFDVDTVPGEDGNTSNLLYTLPADSPWKDFFVSETGGFPAAASYFKAETGENGSYIMTWTAEDNDTMAQAFAQAAKSYLEDHSITTGYTTTYTGQVSGGADGQTNNAVIRSLPAGYYLVTSTGGSLCALGTLTAGSPTYTFDDKQNQPTVTKEVWEDRYGSVEGHHLDNNKGWGQTNDAEIGETVWFRSTITAGGNPNNYALLDFMYPGLTLNQNSFVVYRGTKQLTAKETELSNGDYTVTIDATWSAESNIRDAEMADEMTNYTKNNILTQAGESGIDAQASDKFSSGYRINRAGDDAAGLAISEKMRQQIKGTSCTFAVRFENSVYETLKEGEKLTVIYSATLNKDALISPQGNENITILGYGRGTSTLQTSLLQQAAQSMLAQANNSSQSVLGMLQSLDEPVDDSFGGYADDDFAVEDDADAGIEPMMVIQNNMTAMTAMLEGYRGFTLPASTMTYTYQMDVVKVDGANNVLKGAQFRLLNAAGEVIPLVPYTAPTTTWANWTLPQANQVPSNVLQLLQNEAIPTESIFDQNDIKLYRPALPGETGVETVTAGILAFVGLDDGLYLLEETAAPEGYNKIAEPIRLTVVSDAKADGGIDAHGGSNPSQIGYGTLVGRELLGTAKLRVGDSKTLIPLTMGADALTGSKDGISFDASEGGLPVVNLVGNELPHTGGMGTTLFYVIGGLLVVGAGVLLVVKKRMKNED